MAPNAPQHNNLYLNNLASGGGKRLLWIDSLKGITIIGVIWVHATGHPDWLTPSTVNTLFFFIAGMFFKERPFIDFVKKNARSLLLPFLIFYLLSYPFRIIIELWDFRYFDSVTWNMIWDILKIEARADYLYSYVPLWFLLCLFWVQLFYWMISKVPLWCKLLILIGIWLSWDILESIPTPFMINNALCWLLYFSMGEMLSKLIFRIVNSKRHAIFVLILSIITMFIAYIINSNGPLLILFYMAWCFTMVMAASIIGNFKFSKWLEFFGINSLVILGAHLWFLVPIMRFFAKINNGNDIITSVFGTLICATLMIPTILFINKHFPILSGKKYSSKSLSSHN